MPVTQDELDSFHRFASTRLSNGGSQLTFDDLIIEWESIRDRDNVNAAIREGIADADAGRHRPAGEIMEELRKKYDIPSE